MSTFIQCAQWIVIIPFLVGAFIIIAPFLFPISRDSRQWKALCMMLSVGAVLYGAVHSVLIFSELAKNGPGAVYVHDTPWFVTGGFTLTMGTLIDGISAVMLMVVTMVSLLVQIYTHAYMREDSGYSRFYAYLSLFTGSMLGLVLATNLFQMYFFWELVAVCSYLLIGYWWFKPSASYACFKAFVVNRLGDCGFLIGILMLLYFTWGFWQAHPNSGILSFASTTGDVDLTQAIRWAFMPPAGYPILTTGILFTLATFMLLGPMAKSAQFPLHVWLPDAMEGPTPISALIHAATMVAAGVYMVARAYPIWLNWSNPASPTTLGSDALAVVAWVGCFTAFMAATVALTQTDIKRTLAWSTCSQLGYMFAGLGVGAFTGGIFHLFTHAFFKAMLFLCSGAVIHALHGEQDMTKMGGLGKALKFTAPCFLVGCLAISGCPGFSGFFSKDEIIGGAFNWAGRGHEALCWILVLTAGMTAFYMFRMFFMTFTNEYRGTVHPHAETKLTPLQAPLVALAVPSVFAGFVGFQLAAWQGTAMASPFAGFVHFGNHEEAVNLVNVGISVLFALTGFVLAWLMYKSKSIKWNEAIASGAPWLYQFSLNRWYMDDVYHGCAAMFLKLFTGVWTLIDSMIIDDFKEHKSGIVNSIPQLVRGSGALLRLTENGKGQGYAMVIFASVAAISLIVYFLRPGG